MTDAQSVSSSHVKITFFPFYQHLSLNMAPHFLTRSFLYPPRLEDSQEH